MLTKTITFNDLDGNPVTETFYFNLNKAELAEMELSKAGGFVEHLKAITASGDGALIISTFKEIVTKSVGRRSEDGRRFIKNQDITDEFLQSEAYSEMFLSLVTDADAGAEFIRAVMPKDLVERVDAGQKPIENLPDVVAVPEPAQEGVPEKGSREFYIKKLEDPDWLPNAQDIMKMDKDLVATAYQRKAAAPKT